jgi:hypothetical protein
MQSVVNMNISLDYDGTYTRDPDFWNAVVASAMMRGHIVYVVTFRTPEQGVEVLNSIGKIVGKDHVYFTSMQSKRNYMEKNGISIDVWIDDMPDCIIRGIDTEVNDGKIYLP